MRVCVFMRIAKNGVKTYANTQEILYLQLINKTDEIRPKKANRIF